MRVCQERDRISYMPDLIHIIFFLPMKDAMRTSILSKQWKSITSSLPNFEFDQFSATGKKFTPVEFRNFIDTMVARHDGSHIQRFCLNVKINKPSMSFDHVYAWMGFAVDHNVKEIELEVDDIACMTMSEESRRLPSCFFTCKTVTVLILYGVRIEWPSIVSFPALKSFTLQEVVFDYAKTISGIISSSACPVLEYLSIIYCELPQLTPIIISNPSIKYIKVYDNNNLPIKISITTLRELQCICVRPFNLSFENLSTLISATFHFLDNYDDLAIDLDKEFSCATKLIHSLGNVKTLNLNTGATEILCRGQDVRACLQTPCCSVKYLRLSMYSFKIHAQLIKLLLQIYPNVQTLQIDVEDPVGGSTFSKTADMEEAWHMKEISHENIWNCLETITILNFHGFEAELDIVRYLVENAKFLKKLNIKQTSSSQMLAKVGSQREAQMTALMSFVAKDFPKVSTFVGVANIDDYCH
ncbi:hypothetical protein ACHQM5_028259 [Ranunculus cassubicifolius]